MQSLTAEVAENAEQSGYLLFPPRARGLGTFGMVNLYDRIDQRSKQPGLTIFFSASSAHSAVNSFFQDGYE